jgi:outer membrane protein OmpA-like peptidoglycan-associated protein
MTSVSGGSVVEFSPDGTKIVWTEIAGQNWLIKIANANGTNSATVISGSTSPSAGGNPTFSPNGNSIAFDYGNDIYELSASVTGKTISDATRITTSSGMGMGARMPKYLSATKIAFVGGQPTNSCSSSAYSGIYVKDMTVTGNGSVLSNSCNSGMNRTYAIDFDVSPDGQWIAYRGIAIEGFIALIKTDNTGSRVSVYTASSGSNTPGSRPVFAPDGTKILYDKSSSREIVSFDGTTVGSPTAVVFPSSLRFPSNLAWAPASAVLAVAPAASTPTASTPAAPVVTTPAAPVVTTPAAPAVTTPAAPVVTTTASYANAIPGVTVTDAKVYTKAPVKVASDSAINAMTAVEAKTFDIISKTPSVCLPNDNDLVFLDDGKCIATVVNEKTRKVLRTLRTTVVETDISELKVGNEIAVLSPLYFSAGSAIMKSTSAKRLSGLAITAKAAGSILIAGHSGNLMGNTPENQALSKARAAAVVVALKKLGTTAPIAIAAVGALDPESKGSTQAAQDKNRRAVVVLIP